MAYLAFFSLSYVAALEGLGFFAEQGSDDLFDRLSQCCSQILLL